MRSAPPVSRSRLRARRAAPRARGLTLAELLMAMTITSIVSMVLGGLILAVHDASAHTEGLQEATAQAQAAIERIKYSVAGAGIYQVSGQPMTLGLAALRHQWSLCEPSDVLVVWNGGRNGGMADAGLQTRLPQLNELTIYTLDPAAPSRLVEMTLPNDSSSIDFRDTAFSSAILDAIERDDAEKVVLCQRIRVSDLSEIEGMNPSSVGNIWFELQQTPDDADIAMATPGTDSWNNLMWAQGIVGSDFGMRQATLRIELQVELRAARTGDTNTSPPSMPFFGSASYRYVYEP